MSFPHTLAGGRGRMRYKSRSFCHRGTEIVAKPCLRYEPHEIMGADNSRLFSPSEEEDFPVHGYRRMRSERREATSTTIDIGFAIRARSCKAGVVGTGLVSSGGEPSMLQRMVSVVYTSGRSCVLTTVGLWFYTRFAAVEIGRSSGCTASFIFGSKCSAQSNSGVRCMIEC